MLESMMIAADDIAARLEEQESEALILLETAAEYDGLPGFSGVATALRGMAQECRLHHASMAVQLEALRAAILPHLGERPTGASRH